MNLNKLKALGETLITAPEIRQALTSIGRQYLQQLTRSYTERAQSTLSGEKLTANQAIIQAVIKAHENEKGEPLSAEARAYNEHYWHPSLTRKNIPFTLLRVDDPPQVFYPTNGGIFPTELGGIDANQYFWSRPSNQSEIIQTLHERQAEIKANLAQSSLAIMINHSSWQNIPFLVAAMKAVYNLPSEQFYVLVGPSLTTIRQGFEGAAIANLIKTIPPTAHGQLPEPLQALQKIILKKSMAQIKSTLKTPGNIFLYCPFGTTDKEDPVTQKLILNAQNPSVLKFQRFINAMAPILPLGTDDRAVFSGTKAGQKGRIEMRLGSIHPKASVKDDAAQQMILEELANLIQNPAGESVAELRLPLKKS